MKLHIQQKGDENLVVQKRFPADTDLTKEVTFLKDSRIDAELYAYLQSLSYPIDGMTVVMKIDLPVQAKICEKIGVKSAKTLRAHLQYLIDTGYVIDHGDRLELPNIEDIYLLLPLETIQFITDTIKESVIKVYIYLGQRWKFKPMYAFTQEEIAQHLGLKLQGNPRARQMIHNALDLLQNNGLIKFENFFDGKSPRYRLTNWSYQYIKSPIG